MIYILFIINMLLAFAVCGFLWKKKNIVFLLVTCFLTFFCEYIVCSGLLFWCNHFSMVNVLIILAVVNLVFVVGGWIRRRTWFQVEWNLKPYIIPLVIVLCILPFTWSKFEYFGMGQDQGVYQTHAIALINGYNDLQLDFKEYNTLETQEEKDYFKEMLQTQLIGLYNYDPELPFASPAAEKSDVSAVFHGVPTFASMLALWGSMFGISHMADIQTLFFLCAIFLLNFCLDRLKIKNSVKAIVTVIFALSPLILWSSKSSLTEIELACFVLMFIYLILGADKRDIYYSMVPVAAFSFFHITIYTMIPMILCIYWFLYIYTQKNVYIFTSLGVIIAFAAGITMIAMIAGTYAFINNFTPIYSILPIANAQNIMYIIWGCCVIACIISMLLYIWKLLRNVLLQLLRKCRWIFFYGVLVLLVLYQFKVILNNRERFQGLTGAFTHSTMVGFAYATGIFLLIVAGVLCFFKGKLLLKGQKNAVILIMFLYCICFYSGFMWKYIEYYYYYGRYLVPYISVALLFTAMVFQTLSSRWVCIAGILSIVCLLPYSCFLINHKDDTRVTWNVIDRLSSIISEDDAVVINAADMMYYYLPIKTMTGASVYPSETDYLQQMEELEQQGFSNIYYICIDGEYVANAEVVYEVTYRMSQDNNIYSGKYIPYPKDFSYDDKHIICSRMEK